MRKNLLLLVGQLEPLAAVETIRVVGDAAFHVCDDGFKLVFQGAGLPVVRLRGWRRVTAFFRRPGMTFSAWLPEALSHR